MIYFDNAATTKVSDEVIIEVVNYSTENYFNASSKHICGVQVNEIVGLSREKVSRLIHCNKEEIIFNSGATEGVNTLIRGYVEANIDKGNHIITTKVEHKAVLETCKYLENIGIDVTYLDVNENGQLSIEELLKSIRKDTILVSCLWVNNETGIIQDIKSIAKIVSKFNAKLFVDATQAVGKIDVDVNLFNIDMLCFSSHKIHGPKGVGAVYIRKGIKVSPILYGGGQEAGFRSGTCNSPGIIGFAKACELCDTNSIHVQNMNTYLEKRLKDKFNCKIVGEKATRSAYITDVIFNGIDAEVVICKLKELMISTGSACNSMLVEPSHVLKNMGYSDLDNFSSLRFSISKYTTIPEIDSAIEELNKFISKKT